MLSFGEVPDCWPIGLGHPCVGCTEQTLAFRVPMHDTVTIDRPTPPDSYPPIAAPRGGVTAVATGVAGLIGAGAEFLTKQGPWGVAVVAVVLVAGSGAIWLLSRRKPVDHTNVNEPAGVVTTAIASVSPPPVGTTVTTDLKTTIHAPAEPQTDPARPATV